MLPPKPARGCPFRKPQPSNIWSLGDGEAANVAAVRPEICALIRSCCAVPVEIMENTAGVLATRGLVPVSTTVVLAESIHFACGRLLTKASSEITAAFA